VEVDYRRERWGESGGESKVQALDGRLYTLARMRSARFFWKGEGVAGGISQLSCSLTDGFTFRIDTQG